MSATDTIKIMAMGIIIGLLAIIAMNRSGKATAADAASAGNIIALSNTSKSNVLLFLIDTETKHIATYVADDTQFGFSYCRSYAYDVLINEVDKFKRQGYTVEEANKMYKKNKELK